MSIHLKTESQLFDIVCASFNLPLAARTGIRTILGFEAVQQKSNLRTVLVDIVDDQENYVQEDLILGGHKPQNKNRNKQKNNQLPATTKAHTGNVKANVTQIERPEWSVNSSSMAKKQIVEIRHRDDVAPDKERVPTVYYAPGVLEKIKFIVADCATEVGWWGPVERSSDGDFTILDVFVPRQQVSGTETLISDEAMVAMFMEYAAQGGNTDDLYYWGHSHVNMGVSPSGQDETQVQKFLASCKYFIREIRNKNDNVKMDVYDRDARKAYLNVDYLYFPNEWEEQLSKTVKANVTRAVYTPPVTPAYSGTNNYGR